jgi:hypothetical protein
MIYLQFKTPFLTKPNTEVIQSYAASRPYGSFGFLGGEEFAGEAVDSQTPSGTLRLRSSQRALLTPLSAVNLSARE